MMSSRTSDEAMLVDFVLDDLSEEQREQVEERFFTDDLFYQNLLLVEDDLIYDYFRGALEPDLRAKFEKRLNASPGWKQKVDAVMALMEQVDGIASREPVVQRRPGGAFAPPLGPTASGHQPSSPWIAALATIRSPAFGLAAAAAMLLIALAGGIYGLRERARLGDEVAQLERGREEDRAKTREREEEMRGRITALEERERNLAREVEAERRRRSETEQAAANQRSSDLSVASFLLLPGLVRGSDEPERVLIPEWARRVELRLDLERDTTYRRFRAELRTGSGRLLWSGPVHPPVAGESAPVVLSLPARTLAGGEYEVTLLGARGDGSFETLRYYYFLAMRQ
jgi:hypothetical protein